MAKSISPMMQQYLDIKRQHKDMILFFRLGDFYEMFFEDAVVCSRELELTLTGKECGLSERAPMCGVPFHSADSYIARLIGKGYKVAICEQTEDPKATKGLVKREVVRIITPGTLVDPNALDASKNNYICCLYKDDGGASVAFADVTTGEMSCTSFEGEGFTFQVFNELARFSPSEIVVNELTYSDRNFINLINDKFRVPPSFAEEDVFEKTYAESKIAEHFGKSEIEGADDYCIRVTGALFEILAQTQKIPLSHITSVSVYREGQFMDLDINTRRNLEITETIRDKSKAGSLLSILDKTGSSMGARMLRKWMEQPLLNCVPIRKRLNAVEEFVKNTQLREKTAETLKGLPDIERLVSRTVYKTANARDLISLKNAAERIAELTKILSDTKSAMLSGLNGEIDTLDDLKTVIEAAIVDDPPFSTKEGGMIKEGYDEDVDKYRNALKSGQSWMKDLEIREKERTGIKTLKVGFNKVFGYYIEVSNSFKNSVPPDFIRKQTLTNGERFITDELKKLEETVLNAGERRSALELEIFEKIRDDVAAAVLRIQKTVKAVSSVDCLCSLATAAVKYNYCKPEVNNGNLISIKDGRHPVVEAMQKNVMFVPNDTYLDCDDNRLAIITGPNMAGKSTYMRQTAVITLMAQMGSFVPAKSAEIGIVDKVFTRVGASDDIASGQSTFMVEMSEVAYILKNATSKSLLILDEIGRGTSTFDGLSIAWSVVEHVANKKKLGAKTLFATHYHELTDLETIVGGVKNYNIAVKRRGEDVIFLRKIIKGGADESYGVEVARLAGVPDSVIKRAREIMKQLESGEQVNVKASGAPVKSVETTLQSGFFDNITNEITEEIKNMDFSAVTPIEALNKLYEYQSKLR